jgi:hypothetical protein
MKMKNGQEGSNENGEASDKKEIQNRKWKIASWIFIQMFYENNIDHVNDDENMHHINIRQTIYRCMKTMR